MDARFTWSPSRWECTARFRRCREGLTHRARAQTSLGIMVVSGCTDGWVEVVQPHEVHHFGPFARTMSSLQVRAFHSNDAIPQGLPGICVRGVPVRSQSDGGGTGGMPKYLGVAEEVEPSRRVSRGLGPHVPSSFLIHKSFAARAHAQHRFAHSPSWPKPCGLAADKYPRWYIRHVGGGLGNVPLPARRCRPWTPQGSSVSWAQS